MRLGIRFLLAFCLVALSWSASSAQNQTYADRAILSAAQLLEKAMGGATPAEKKKLREAAEYLKDLTGTTAKKNDNGQLLEFNDNATAFRGKTLTFEMQLSEMGGDGLQEFSADRPTCTLTARVGDPAATVKVVVDYSKIADKVPNARVGDRVVVTFDSVIGDVKRGNVAKSITRPK